jgi:hypothetical protein
MNRHISIPILTITAILSSATAITAASNTQWDVKRTTGEHRPPDGNHSAAVLFVPNAGQFDPRVHFQSRNSGSTFWFTDAAVWLTVVRGTDGTQETEGNQELRIQDSGLRTQNSELRTQGVNLRLTFASLSPQAHWVALDPQPSRLNYLLGRQPDHWHTNVPTAACVGKTYVRASRSGLPANSGRSRRRLDLTSPRSDSRLMAPIVCISTPITASSPTPPSARSPFQPS